MGRSWSYGSCHYLRNQCLSPLTLWVRILLRRDVLNTKLCDKVCEWLTAGRWFSLCTPVSSTNKQMHALSRDESGRFGALKSDSIHHFFRNACTKSGSLRFSVFRLLTDFVCLYTYEFWLSLWKIVRSSIILLLPYLYGYIHIDDFYEVSIPSVLYGYIHIKQME